jgi:hypothetical protein
MLVPIMVLMILIAVLPVMAMQDNEAMTVLIFVMIPVVNDRDVSAPVFVMIPMVDHRDMAMAITAMVVISVTDVH